MPLPQDQSSLQQLRLDTFAAYQSAKANNLQDKMDEAIGLLTDIDNALDALALGQLAGLAGRLTLLKAGIASALATAKSWPFGTAPAPSDHERPNIAVPPGEPTVTDPDNTGETTVATGPNDYLALWRSMEVSPDWKKKADAVARRIIAAQNRYATVVAGTSVPWWFVAVVHAMECSLNFTEHLHNGDPLTARTVHEPSGRPPSGSPPFSWEESATDAIAYEGLTKIASWPMSTVLYRWHCYNGVKNEYTRRGIPTPYLWSGSQHYQKGKYIADHVFDPEKVSGQVGAAVILRSLIDLGAVVLADDAPAVAGKPATPDNPVIAGNPAVATGHQASLVLPLDDPSFMHARTELDFPGTLSTDLAKSKSNSAAIRRAQEWLNLQDCVTPIDGGYGDSTKEQVRRFQEKNGRPQTGEIDAETWALLTEPMRRALAPLQLPAGASLEDAVIAAARQHIAQKPTEIGGNNRGPWVRLYMKGDEGEAQKWCAGFVSLMVAQACRDLGIKLPFKRQVGVDALVADAKASGRFIGEKDVKDPVLRRSRVTPGMLFVVRASPTDWTHTGIVLQLKDTTFDSLEGNTGGDGGTDGPNARIGNRSYAGKDFIRLV